MVRNGWSELRNRFVADIAGLKNRLELSEFAAHLLKPAGGLRCNSLLWLELINPSLFWPSLVNYATTAICVYKGLWGTDCVTGQEFATETKRSCSHPFAPEELERSVAVGEIVRSSKNSTSLHWETFSAQHLEEGQQPHLGGCVSQAEA